MSGDFQRISFDEANPAMMGAKRMQELMQMPAEFQRQLLANQILQAKAQYAPQSEQANLLQTQLQNQKMRELMPLVVPNQQSEINYRNSQTNETNQMLPLKLRNQENINEWYPQKAAQDIATAKANAEYKRRGGANLGTGASEEIFLEDLIAKDNPHLKTPEQIFEARNNLVNGKTTLSDGTKLNPLSPASRAALDRITKGTNTAQGLNQQRFAGTTDALLDEGSRLMPVVSQYSGLLGKGQGNIDAVKNSLGADTPAYNDYVYFTRTVVPASAGEMMRAFGVNASDEQKKLYMSVVNPFSWDQNPKAAMDNYNKMANMFKNVVSPQVAKPISQLQQELQNRHNNKSASSMTIGTNEKPKYTPEEIKEEIKRRKLKSS